MASSKEYMRAYYADPERRARKNEQARLRYKAYSEWSVHEKRQRLDRRAEYAQELRRAVLQRLGNACIKCGFSDARALQVDHIYSDGKIERHKPGVSFYKKLLKAVDLYDRYQLLCANCNWIKRYEANEVKRIVGVCR